jgi:hypothetical protein
MSALFLLMIPPIALATHRGLTAKRLGRVPAAVASLLVAVALTVAPAWALRTKEKHGAPVQTPVGPGFGETTGRVDLPVDYVGGWSAPVQMGGQTVRRLSGSAQLAVGPLEATRPHATLSFAASAVKPTRVAIRLSGSTVLSVEVRSTPRRIAVDVPQGTGPAVYDIDVASGGVIVVAVSSVHAAVGSG